MDEEDGHVAIGKCIFLYCDDNYRQADWLAGKRNEAV